MSRYGGNSCRLFNNEKHLSARIFLLCISHLYSQEEGHISLIEHSELYAPSSDPSQDLLNPHKDCKFLSKLNDPAHLCQTKDGSEPIIRSLASANVSKQVMDGVLHSRELGMQKLPSNIKTLLHRNQADDFKVKLRKSLADGTWGLPDIVDPESVVQSPPLLPPPSQRVYSPTPTVQSNLSSFKSPASTAPPSVSRAPSDSILGQAAHLGNSDQHAITYYNSSSPAASSPASTHISLHAPPTSDHAHSQLHNYTDVRSPNNSYSAVSSPTSSGMGVVSSLSPASSFMSSTTSIQRPVKRKDAPGFDSAGNTGFSMTAPDVAIASTFGNTSTNFPPNFSEVPFQQQKTQIPVPCESLSGQYSGSFNHQPVLPINVDNDSELSEILDHFDSVPSTMQTQGQDGNNFLQNINISKMNPGEIQYYDSDASSDHLISANHHMMTGDVMVSGSAVSQFMGTADQQNGTDIMEILSQFS